MGGPMSPKQVTCFVLDFVGFGISFGSLGAALKPYMELLWLSSRGAISLVKAVNQRLAQICEGSRSLALTVTFDDAGFSVSDYAGGKPGRRKNAVVQSLSWNFHDGPQLKLNLGNVCPNEVAASQNQVGSDSNSDDRSPHQAKFGSRKDSCVFKQKPDPTRSYIIWYIRY